MDLEVYSVDGTFSAKKNFENFPELIDGKGVGALKSAVVGYQAALRQGSACAKRRGEVSGSGKKPWRQKGTGMARHGSRRSPIWPKGGVVFGPLPRDYSQKLNKKVKLLALKRALFDCISEKKLSLIEQLFVKEVKTKLLNQLLNSICSKGYVLLVDVAFDENVVLSARNLERVDMIDVASINALDLLRYHKVVVTEAAFSFLLKRIAA